MENHPGQPVTRNDIAEVIRESVADCAGLDEFADLLDEEKKRSAQTRLGTWLTGRLPQPPPGEGGAFNRRINWKVGTLREMHSRGIWLLDASVHAIYLGNEERIPLEIQNQLHRQWWEGYGRHVVESCGEAKLWVVGRTVHRALGHLHGWQCDGWVYQPTANGVDLERNWPGLLEECRRPVQM